MTNETRIPEPLSMSWDLLQAIKQADEVIEGLRKLPEDPVIDLQIQLAEENRKEIEKEIESLKPEHARIMKAMNCDYRYFRARAYIELHYICGFSWEEVVDLIGGRRTQDAVKACVYRALNELQEQGKI